MPTPPNSKVSCYDVSLPPYSGNIQLAINDASTRGGGIVYIPTGMYSLAASGTLVVPPNSSNTVGLTLLGDGPDATIIRTSTQQVILKIQGTNTAVYGITFQGAGAGGTPANGIEIGDPTPGVVMGNVTIERCSVRGTGRYCLSAVGAPQTSINCRYSDCHFSSNASGGAAYIGPGNTTHIFRGCTFYNFFDYGAALSGGVHGVAFHDCVFELSQNNGQPYLYADQAVHCALINCWFEEQGTPGTHAWFIQLDRSCHAFSALGCTFRRSVGSDPHAILVSSPTDPSVGVVIMSPEMLTPAPPTGPNHIFTSTAQHEIQLIGGVARTVAFSPVYPVRINDGAARTMTVGGTNRLKLQRLSDAEVLGLTDVAEGQLVYNASTHRVDVFNGVWAGVATGAR